MVRNTGALVDDTSHIIITRIWKKQAPPHQSNNSNSIIYNPFPIHHCPHPLTPRIFLSIHSLGIHPFIQS